MLKIKDFGEVDTVRVTQELFSPPNLEVRWLVEVGRKGYMSPDEMTTFEICKSQAEAESIKTKIEAIMNNS